MRSVLTRLARKNNLYRSLYPHGKSSSPGLSNPKIFNLLLTTLAVTAAVVSCAQVDPQVTPLTQVDPQEDPSAQLSQFGGIQFKNIPREVQKIIGWFSVSGSACNISYVNKQLYCLMNEVFQEADSDVKLECTPKFAANLLADMYEDTRFNFAVASIIPGFFDYVHIELMQRFIKRYQLFKESGMSNEELNRFVNAVIAAFLETENRYALTPFLSVQYLFDSELKTRILESIETHSTKVKYSMIGSLPIAGVITQLVIDFLSNRKAASGYSE